VSALRHAKRHFITGLFVLLPAWGTFLVLHALVSSIDEWMGELEPSLVRDIPGLGFVSLIVMIFVAGFIATQVFGQRLVALTNRCVERIPVVRSVYVILRGMADVFNFRERFGRSRVVVFPFPRQGLWALGFVMGPVPPAVARVLVDRCAMIFVPTAIHPFTGYLAFVPSDRVIPINLAAEEAMKLEFSAGLYRPRAAWLTRSHDAV
jgi:uncharacterized membrane protein